MTFLTSRFLFIFLPLALIGFQLLGRLGRRFAIGWLALMSLAFYGTWKPIFVLVLLSSLLMNYFISRMISRSEARPRLQHWTTVAGVAANLGLLCYFKYLFPLLGFLHFHGLFRPDWGQVALPLGISFFTFTQIAYLVDLKQGQAKPQSLIEYSLFVTFFPYVISGPIVHHKEIMPQFAEERRYRLNVDDFALGLTWFVMGLFKKVMIADRIAPMADALFAAPAGVGALLSWQGVLTYAMQLYFDFSGYSDMALGLARMFSIRLPFNFNSPYKAAGVIDFWQRWHMTLTRLLTLYLYNPLALAASRRRAAQGKRNSRKALATLDGFFSLMFVPTMATMLLIGAWHGAGIQFLIFGLLHGVYLCVNHAWRAFVPAGGKLNRLLPTVACVPLTFLAVAVSLVFFRAPSLDACWVILGGMIGRHGSGAAWGWDTALLLAGLFAWIWFMPNTQQVLQQDSGSDEKSWDLFPKLHWKPTLVWGTLLVGAFVLSLIYAQSGSTFLYFQF